MRFTAFEKFMKETVAKHVMVTLDCCHSGLLESTLRTEGTVATFASVATIALAAAGGVAARWIGGRGQWVPIGLIVLVAVDTMLAMLLAPSENRPAVDLMLRGVPVAALVATATGLSRMLKQRL